MINTDEILKWASKHNIEEYIIPRDANKLLEIDTLILNNLNLNSISRQISFLPNLQTLILHKNNLIELPKEIINLKGLKKLYLNDNPLVLNPNQIIWINNLKNSGCIVNIDNTVKQTMDMNNDYFIDSKSREVDWMQKIWDWADENNIPNLRYVTESNHDDIELIITPDEEDGAWEGLSRDKEGLLSQTELNLYGLKLTIIPKEIGNLLNLKILGLSNNKLTYLPDEFSNLVNLTELYISENKLPYLPNNIGKLSKLTILHACSNQLNKFSSELCKLTKLTELLLSENNITILPDCISRLCNLNYFSLYKNLIKKIPSSIGKLQRLEKFILWSNQINYLPDEIFHLKKIFILDLEYNPLYFTDTQKELLNDFYSEVLLDEGILHKERSNIVSNQYDKNGDDRWIQKIWDWADENYIKDYTWIENVDDSDFSYWIGIPRNKEDLLWLKELILEEEYFEKIPKEIGNLTSLKNLTINAQLTELPNEIANLINLTSLDIGHNNLTKLPEEIKNLQNLKKLRISSNKFEALPKPVCYLINLNHLNYSISGYTLPKEIANLTKLTSLYIGNNKLTMMPKELGILKNLTSLTIFSSKRNHFLKLPNEITNLTKLKEIKFLLYTEVELTEAQKLWLDKLKKDNDLYMEPNIWEEVQKIPF